MIELFYVLSIKIIIFFKGSKFCLKEKIKEPLL